MERAQARIQARVSLPASLTSPAQARHFAVEVADSWGLPSAELAVVVGELTTNAVVHAQSGFALSLIRGFDAIRVEVSDEAGLHLPVARRPVLDAPGGRGLQIVEQLSSGWGVLGAGDLGKTVWADVVVGGVDWPANTGMSG